MHANHYLVVAGTTRPLRRSPAIARWIASLGEAEGGVYNWGYPAPLKNAIDHLYREWKGKPALIVTYGGHGGDRCARQLREVLTGLDLSLAQAMPGLHLARARIEADDGAIEPHVDFEIHGQEMKDALRELIDLAEVRAAAAD